MKNKIKSSLLITLNKRTLVHWILVQSSLVLVTAILCIYWCNTIALCLAGILSFSYYFYLNTSIFRTLKPFGGYANWVTTFRLLLVLYIAMAWTNLEASTIGIIAISAVSLDGLDGFLARRFKTESEFGAYLDMETDAFYVAVMGTIIYLNGWAGEWILVVAYMRYLYVWIVRLLGWANRQEPHNPYARYIAGILFWSLMSPFFFDTVIHFPILVVATILLYFSFGYSFFKIAQVKE